MAVVARGTLASRGRTGRAMLAGMLLGTTALMLVPGQALGQLIDPEILGLPRVDEVVGLSADGRMALMNRWVSGTYKSYHWNGERYVQLDGPDTTRSINSSALSGNGEVAVGYFRQGLGVIRAFRWTEADGVEDIGTLGASATTTAQAYDVSHDGNVVVGWSLNDSNGVRAFAWIKDSDQGVGHNQEMYELSGVAGFNTSYANAVSADGVFAVGESNNGTEGTATRWDLSRLAEMGSAGIEDLGTLGGNLASAQAVSADGSVVVGHSRLDDNVTVRAFRWVEGSTGGAAGNEDMHDLGVLGDDVYSSAKAVSADGSVVVGMSQDSALNSTAFRWEEESGMISVADWLAANGVQAGSNQFTTALSVSGDGGVVGGSMTNAAGEKRGYIARIDGEAPGGLMDVEEYHRTLFASAGIANAGEYLSWLPMNGAHHRPLMMTPNLSGDMCAWATGDLAHHGGTSTGMGLAEAGACVDLAGGSVRLGTAVGISRSWQDLALGGSARMAGQYVLGEADWQPDGTPLLFSVTGMLGGWQANIERAYSNGAATAVSSGQTNAFGGVVRVRADWLEAAQIGNTSFNPYASIGFGHVHVDGYAETGGPFPARFDAQNLSSADIRLGLTAVTEFSAQTTLSTTFEVAHRSGTAAAAKGSVDGLFAFNIGGGSYGQTWLRAGLELDHKVTENLALSTSVHMATNGRDPSVAGSVGIKAAF